MAAIDTLNSFLLNFGVLEFLLPFFLVFTLSYAILLKSGILGDRKAFNVVVAVVLGLLFVLPHQLGLYPLGLDPVAVLNSSLPSISLVAIAAIMVLLLLGVFDFEFKDKAGPWVALVALGFVIYIFGSAIGFWQSPSARISWWTSDLTELLIIILVFGAIIWFITRQKPEVDENGKRKSASLGSILKDYGETLVGKK